LLRSFDVSRLERCSTHGVVIIPDRGFSKLRLLRLGLAWQDMASLFAGHRGAQFRLESDDQADFLAYSAHIVPGYEEVVGVAHLRLAVMGVQLIAAEHVLACRTGIRRLPAIFIKGIDDEIAFDFDRLLLPILVEHEPPAKSPGRRLALGVADRVDPDRKDA
jgi:hypothetical protein